ncbi:MAG TPA: hypothetical protein VGJ15_06335, partial [Pirellulales bacterium]
MFVQLRLGDGGVKLAVWQSMIGVVLLLATSSLLAATPETLPEPKSAGSYSYDDEQAPSGHVFEGLTSDNPSKVFDERQAFHHDANGDNDMEGNEAAFPYTSSYWWRNGCWYGDFDFVVWNRTRPFGRVLGIDASAVGV